MKDPARSSRRKIIAVIRRIYPHVILIFSMMFTVFWALEKFNPIMGFLSGSISTVLLLIFFLLSFVGSVLFIVDDIYRKKEKKTEEKIGR